MMEFNKNDLVETFDGVFWRVDSVQQKLQSLTVIKWESSEKKIIGFNDVMNRWIEKPL